MTDPHEKKTEILIDEKAIEEHRKNPCSTGKCFVCEYLKTYSTKGKISKLMIWPSRTINLGNYNTAKLNAGVEIVFDTPVTLDSIEVVAALNKARKIIKNEFKEQWKPYSRKKEQKEPEPKEPKPQPPRDATG